MAESFGGTPTGWVCRICGTRVPISAPLSWRCPHASASSPHHALRLVSGLDEVVWSAHPSPNPFLAFRGLLGVGAFAAANGMAAPRQIELIEATDQSIATVAGVGFVRTPFARAEELSEQLGFSPRGGIWVKDETGNVAGSHKARHLFTILLHLLVAESLDLVPWGSRRERPPFAIASCGNAAIAASTLAAAVNWPIRVFVPPWAGAGVTDVLDQLDAQVERCPRRDDDPPGDPCVHRFREAVEQGAIPFSVQGTENAWCLDGGRTLGWELAAVPTIDRVFVQVGGGAFAACTGAGLIEQGLRPRLHAVQSEGCAPLERAWRKAGERDGPEQAASHWSELMWPWEEEPASAADGILDDETYDWLAVFEAMVTTNGGPVVASEAFVVEAHRLALRNTTINVSATGTAGLAGLLACRSDVGDDEQVAVVFSGVAR